ncbi:hypothetical protein ACFFX0_17865 [Citricoccus parietis]|uniref:Uncharacterized protein n=1 Tax=Citricoccus parietis TaxID=592307 RepID=A0ABV5G204_9MICC
MPHRRRRPHRPSCRLPQRTPRSRRHSEWRPSTSTTPFPRIPTCCGRCCGSRRGRCRLPPRRTCAWPPSRPG